MHRVHYGVCHGAHQARPRRERPTQAERPQGADRACVGRGVQRARLLRRQHGDDPEVTLRRLASALIDTAMANRESGGLYRWEGRYLGGDDQTTLFAQMRTVHHRIQRPLVAIRPELTSRQRWTLSTSALSVIGS